MTAESNTRGTLSWRNLLWAIPFLLALALALYIYLGMPHERDLPSTWVLLFKLVPFFLASFSIAWFPRSKALGALLVFATLLPFLGFLVPRALHLAITGFNTDPVADTAALVATFGEFYTIVAILVPYIILALALAYRLGGGSAGSSLKVAWAGLLLMLSGYEDLMFWTVNPRGPMPEVTRWASHINIFFGRPATQTEFYLFIAAHAVLIAVVFVLPLDRVGAWVERRWSRG